jgi:hypothetical protein
VLKRLFGPKRQKSGQNVKKLYKVGLCSLYSTSNIIRVIKLRRMRATDYVSSVAQKINTYMVLVGKREGKGRFARRKHRWGHNIKIYLIVIFLEGVD